MAEDPTPRTQAGSRNAVAPRAPAPLPAVCCQRPTLPGRRPAAGGFTLIEIMVSLAIALIVLIGINQVFTITAETVGTGQAMNDTMRDQRAAQSAFYNDWRGAALADSPCIIINSQATPAFLNAADEASNSGQPPLKIYINGVDSTPPAPAVPEFTYNYRNHRTDTLSFFARGNFPRMTGNSALTDPMISNMSSNEAWINYGHLLLPNNLPTPTYYAPGQADASATDTNANNFYADQWVLGRIAMLLRTPVGGIINDNSATPISQNYYTGTATLAPLDSTSTAGGGGGDNSEIYKSHYDLAGTSIDAFRSKVLAAITDGTLWNSATKTSPLIYRFQCDPYSALDRANYTTNTPLAKTFPYFLKGCTQFMVEFAGDFRSQNSDGSPAAAGAVPDGTTDFYMSGGTRNICWYGMTRDFNVNGSYDPGDVVPVSILTGTAMAFEKVLPTTTNPRYVCIFGPADPKPKMLRITITLTDPGNRLANPQTYEYVLGTP